MEEETIDAEVLDSLAVTMDNFRVSVFQSFDEKLCFLFCVL